MKTPRLPGSDRSVAQGEAIRHVHYLMILALADGPLHGYGLVQEIRARTRGQVRIGPGSIHRNLRQLTEMGWIAESQKSPLPPSLDDNRRRYYELTPAGSSVLARETERLQELVTFARSRIESLS